MVRRRVRNVQVRTRTRVTRGYTAYRRYIYYYYYWREINRLGVAGTTANTRKCAFIGTLIGRVLNLANEPEQYIRARDIQEYKNERREKILKGGGGGDDRRDGKKRRFELIYNVKLQASFNYLTEWDTRRYRALLPPFNIARLECKFFFATTLYLGEDILPIESVSQLDRNTIRLSAVVDLSRHL